jgi:hypothetical protein
MATANRTSGLDKVTAAPKPKSQRMLACALCRRRKIKCDHEFPCANCIRAGAQCVPANPVAAHQRRRRFPERELLERLRYCEGLLRQNGVNFEPWLTPAAAADYASPSEDGKASTNSPDDSVNLESSRDNTVGKSHEALYDTTILLVPEAKTWLTHSLPATSGVP